MLLHQQRKFLLAAPVIVLPFLCGMFYALGGGSGQAKARPGPIKGLNAQLPDAYVKPGNAFLNKAGAYQKADQDSLRKQAFAQQDPYHPFAGKGVTPDSVRRKPAVFLRPVIPPDPKAEELLRQLSRLKESLQQPAPVPRISVPVVSGPASRQRLIDTPANDPQLERLNTMLDKVIRIQHPDESRSMGGRVESSAAENVMPADSMSNGIAAVIPSDQTLVTGGTIPLRLAEAIIVQGVTIPSGGWVYGTVTISNDRMLVHVRSIRDGRNLYPTDLQVYDLDGLPGIHIPDVLSQNVAKESASESVSGLNLLSPDPSLGATAAEAGIQAAKNLVARKARLIKVSVRAGYQVLLKSSGGRLPNAVHPHMHQKEDSTLRVSVPRPPGIAPSGRYLERSRSGDVELRLRGIYLQDSLLWFALEWENRSPIGYTAQYYRWVVKDRKSFKRTAQQELPLEPVLMPGLNPVIGGSTIQQWAGFQPFALSGDKELVLEVGEKGGGRVFTMVIHSKQILHAKTVDP